VKARHALHLAKAELRRWERRYDRCQGDDPMQYVPQIRAAEHRYREAVEALRLVRDGRPRLPQAAATAAKARMPDHRFE